MYSKCQNTDSFVVALKVMKNYQNKCGNLCIKYPTSVLNVHVGVLTERKLLQIATPQKILQTTLRTYLKCHQR